MSDQEVAHAAEELASNLASYERQLAEVEELLLEDPENSELQAIFDNLTEVIQLAQELCQSAPQAGTAQPRQGNSQLGSPPRSTLAQEGRATGTPPPVAAPAALSTLLPPQVAEQIRLAQQRAALSGQGPPAWAVGAKCRAVYSGDGNWYDAVVEAAGHAGTFVVAFEGYGTQEEVGKDAIQLRGAEDDAGYRGVAAPKRRRVDDNVDVQEMPKWLQIKDSDDDKTRQNKRKLAKAYKSKARFARLDLQQKEKADAWKRFIAGKPKKGRATRQTAD